MPAAAGVGVPHPSRERRFRREVELYEPVKRFLEERGYVVKGEVRGCDVVAVRPGDDPAKPAPPPVVVELKLSLTLSFVLQGVDRSALTDRVYLAVPAPPPLADPRRARPALTPDHPGVRRLCRRLGLGLLAVRPSPPPPGDAPSPAHPEAADAPAVEVILDPVPHRLPRRNKKRAALLLREHARRQGDPTPGGGPGGKRDSVTAYRQEALRCAEFMHRRDASHGGEAAGASVPVAAVRDGAAAPGAARILYRNVHGWFEPTGQDLYRLTEAGKAALQTFAGRYEVVPPVRAAERR